MMTRTSLVAMAVLFLYGAPAHALTPPTRVAPPGNSGATQYQEDVPSASGGVPVVNLPAASGPASAGSPASAGGPSQVLPRSVVTKLDRAGTAGRAAASLADRTAPAPVRVHGPHVAASGQAASSVDSQITNAVIGGGGGGLGLLLPLTLAGSLIIATATVLVRRRHTA